ncbi:unnamed protein product, partial [Iphiclides podalirius]
MVFFIFELGNDEPNCSARMSITLPDMLLFLFNRQIKQIKVTVNLARYLQKRQSVGGALALAQPFGKSKRRGRRNYGASAINTLAFYR